MNISTGNLAVCAMESFNNRSMQILDFSIPVAHAGCGFTVRVGL